LTFFCVGWFLSAFVSSPAFDVCGGLITPFIVLSGIVLVDWALKISRLSEHGLLGLRDCDVPLAWYYCTICLVISVVCFGAGTWRYLRRVEP
jgi:hypothetical protein